MEEPYGQPIDPSDAPSPAPSQSRRFVYRAVEPGATHTHPLRRSTDIPPEFRDPPAPTPKTELLKFRIYLKPD